MKTLLVAIVLASVSLADCPAQQSAPTRQRVTVRETVYEPLPEQPRLVLREAPVVREVQFRAAPLYFVPVAPVTREKTIYRGPLGRERKVVTRTYSP